jgi:hypothetical protein
LCIIWRLIGSADVVGVSVCAACGWVQRTHEAMASAKKAHIRPVTVVDSIRTVMRLSSVMAAPNTYPLERTRPLTCEPGCEVRNCANSGPNAAAVCAHVRACPNKEVLKITKSLRFISL